MTYRYGLGIRVISPLGAAMFIFFALRSGIAEEPYTTAALCGLALFCSWVAIETWGYLTISESGLRYVYPLRANRQMSWEDIDEIRFRNLLGRLDLHNKQTGTVLYIPDNLNGFAQIRELLSEIRPELFKTEEKQAFNCGRSAKIVVSVCSTLSIGSGLLPYDSGSGIRVLLIAIGFLFPLFLLREPERIRLEPEDIVIEYPLHERKISRTEIEDIQLEQKRESDPSSEIVVIYLSGGEREVLGDFQVGEIRFFSALEEWFEEKY